MGVDIQQNIIAFIFLNVFISKINTEIYLKPTEFNLDSEIEDSNAMLVVVPRGTLDSEFLRNYEEPLKGNLTALGDLNLTSKQAEMLRKSWRDSCDRRAARVCRKACVNTYKIVCSAYLCKRSMKRAFKRECKRNCKARFSTSSRTDSE